MENFRKHGLGESLYRYTKKDLTVIRTIIMELHWLAASEKYFLVYSTIACNVGLHKIVRIRTLSLDSKRIIAQ